jgi:16S rRNA (guanine527-N7)-methyltransferase
MTMDKLISGVKSLNIELLPSQLEKFETYYSALVDWNRRINLTAILDYEKAQILHFLDSLSVVLAFKDRKVLEKPGLKVLDVGTGAGLPGIPLKIAFPNIYLCLMDSIHKKSLFLNYIIGKLGLTEAVVITGRAEELGHYPTYREQFDLVLSRAVAAMPALVELCLPFCCSGGKLIALKKGDVAKEVKQAEIATSLMGGGLPELVPVNLEGLQDERYLVVIEKVRETPPSYPRRVGLPVKRPITSPSTHHIIMTT